MEIKIDLSKVRIEDGAMILDLDNDTIQSVRDGGKIELGSLNVGDRFMIGDDRFIVLEHTDNGTKVISESFIYTSKGTVIPFFFLNTAQSFVKLIHLIPSLKKIFKIKKS